MSPLLHFTKNTSNNNSNDNSNNNGIVTFSATLDGIIEEQADPVRIKGYPMESLFYVDAWNALSGHVVDLPQSEKEKRNIYTHRELALQKVVTHLQTIL